MVSKLNIKLLHLNLTDTQARIISLLVYGLEYDEIELFLGIEVQTIRNYVSVVCGKLELEGAFHLISVARTEGFDSHGNFDTIALFAPGQIKALLRKFPVSRRKVSAPPTP